MSLKKIEQILKSSKTIIIINFANGEQWLSNGCAAYSVRNLPTLTRENFLAILNVDDSKKDKYYIQEVTSDYYSKISFADSVAEEAYLERETLQLVLRKTAYRTFIGETGIIFAPARYFKPFDEEDSEYTFYERYNVETGTPYIAVKKGLLLDGIIMPEFPARDPFFAATFKEMSQLISLESAKRHIEDENEGGGARQTSLFKWEEVDGE